MANNSVDKLSKMLNHIFGGAVDDGTVVTMEGESAVAFRKARGLLPMLVPGNQTPGAFLVEKLQSWGSDTVLELKMEIVQLKRELAVERDKTLVYGEYQYRQIQTENIKLKHRVKQLQAQAKTVGQTEPVKPIVAAKPEPSPLPKQEPTDKLDPDLADVARLRLWLDAYPEDRIYVGVFDETFPEWGAKKRNRLMTQITGWKYDNNSKNHRRVRGRGYVRI